MNTPKFYTLQETSKILNVSRNRVQKLAIDGILIRVGTGKYDRKSVNSFKLTNLSKYDQRKATILSLITNEWSENKCSTTINDLAKATQLSTSVVWRYIAKMEKEGLIEVHNKNIYPGHLYETICKAINGYFNK